jgi:succinate dehydrogenase/fumarate reductase flavoprotein subunit
MGYKLPNNFQKSTMIAMQTEIFEGVVRGTGAAGMVAALAAHGTGARVALYENADVIGGTTTLSGGVCWLPCNPLAAQAGLHDSREDALLYLRSLSHGLISEGHGRVHRMRR